MKIKNRELSHVNAWFWKHWGIGYGILIGRFYGIINFILLISVFLMNKGIEVSFIQTLVFGIVSCVIIFVSGLIYVKFDFQKAEFSSGFKEQPEMVKMKQDIEEIKEMLKSRVKK